LEIRDLAENPEQFTLFILAWDKIRGPGYQPAAAQWEQQAGIHGMPYTPWPGDPDGRPEESPHQWLGYCNHASILFPHWHRPYLMLLEQSICEEAQGIAGTFADKYPNEAKTWMQAARELRFPFWDWTLPITGEEGLPKILYQSKLRLAMPDGESLDHDNILASYTFNAPIDGFNDRLEYTDIHLKDQAIAYFKQWARTYRWPSSTPNNPTENIEGLNAEFTNKKTDPPQRGSWIDLTSKVSNLFGFPITVPEGLEANVWDEFSNTTFQSGRPDKDGKLHSPYVWHCGPIEQPHNSVHLVIGGIGHMADNDTAAFDPIFYLHHCNVDRLIAFWEHIYPDYVPGTKGYLDVDGITLNPFMETYGTIIETSGRVVDGKTSLNPFRKGDYTYWTSEDAQSLNSDALAKYYTYPPIEGVKLGEKLSPEERDIQRAILQKHFGFNPVVLRRQAPIIEQPIFSHAAHSVLPPGYEPVQNYRHFIISASLAGHAFNGSYSVRISLSTKEGSVPLGSLAVLGRGNSTKCGNCQNRRAVGTRVRGVVVIPHEAVANFIQSEGLNDKDTSNSTVIERLKEKLCACVVLPSGKVYGQRLEGSPKSKAPALPLDVTPSLRLHSSNVSALEDQVRVPHDPDVPQDSSPKTPYEFYDWQDHGLLGGHWIKGADNH